MATIGTFNAWTIFYNEDFDPIVFEYSMLLNSRIEKKPFFDILRKYQ